jgi:hypothetical protein
MQAVEWKGKYDDIENRCNFEKYRRIFKDDTNIIQAG